MGAPDKRKHILVVNDDPAILELFTELLSEEGWDVVTDNFNSGTGDVHRSIRDIQPDLVIMDYIIGGEGAGWQLLQMVKMDRKTREIPVIVCTGAVRQIEDLRLHLNEMGVQVVLKPFDIDELISVIKEIWDT